MRRSALGRRVYAQHAVSLQLVVLGALGTACAVLAILGVAVLLAVGGAL